jgi:two-component system NtrC family sensor kinase
MHSKPRILLVDDEQSVLNALQRFFRRSGYDVTTCTSGREGLAILEDSEPFHLVISDYRMPEMSGVEFLSAVRVRWVDTVRMVLSGFADTSAIISATNEGNIYKFISKPWDEAFLLQSVQEALELYARNKKNSQQIQTLSETLENLGSMHADDLTNQSLVLSAYHTLLDQMPVGLIGIDQEYEIVSMNERARQILGLSVSPLGEPASVVLPGIFDATAYQNAQESEKTLMTLNGVQIQIESKRLHEGSMNGVMLILALQERSE